MKSTNEKIRNYYIPTINDINKHNVLHQDIDTERNAVFGYLYCFLYH